MQQKIERILAYFGVYSSMPRYKEAYDKLVEILGNG